MSRLNDLIGRRFGMLTVVSRAPNYVNPQGGKCSMWNCVCDCGNNSVHRGSHLSSGAIVSCGCYGLKAMRDSLVTHNGCHTRLYGVWRNMVNRCYNQKVKSYKNYGGRGIVICDEWKNDFAAFRVWAYSTGYDDAAAYQQCTIERKDFDGNYEPSNCCWATAKEQSNNRRPAAIGNRNHLVEYDGRIFTMTQLAASLGVTGKCIQGRLRRNPQKYGYVDIETMRPEELERMKQEWK